MDLILLGAIAIGIPPIIGVCIYWIANKIKQKRHIKWLFTLCYIGAVAFILSGVLVFARAHRYCCCDMRPWTGMGGGFLGISLLAFGLYFALCITISKRFIKNNKT